MVSNDNSAVSTMNKRNENESMLYNDSIKNELPKRSNGIPTIPCSQCDKKFRKVYNMRKHVVNIHNKIKRWTCQFCTKNFADKSTLTKHLLCHGYGEKYKCKDCGRESNSKDSMILHRNKHNNEKTHFCQECGKGFFKSSCLQRHSVSHKEFPSFVRPKG